MRSRQAGSVSGDFQSLEPWNFQVGSAAGLFRSESRQHWATASRGLANGVCSLNTPVTFESCYDWSPGNRDALNLIKYSSISPERFVASFEKNLFVYIVQVLDAGQRYSLELTE